jgi:hypothetical protein
MSDSCEHKFVFLRSSKHDEYGNYNTHYVRIDYFYCEHCLKYEERKQEEWLRETPIWFIEE